ncbi:MAG TPA: gluconate 2-dehydrogenase subunit 3 family protein [Haliscomenobacter sp.]|uniref:gluconate 2-dehydrogenase subunit 3 family protein n=1 Tax=Haliscomenobacter sp. TaxID=2717303 RepID=UPI002D167E34|nr:gluconate 2-dehydrogenase subunit 3 family protein [Haliscomenobacter sp.]HOY21402.1 gluconate 2-dehydrogenase subunit 3 family protein [Haliscomenobacter sp.]HPH21442.1 gluconate 2-dehydrogenase subunit 3 family protein [Haliscomenobacter sp.]
MNRREALAKATLLLGGALSGPTLLALGRWENATALALRDKINLSAQQKQLIAEVAEMIIPRTDTVGAKDVGVPAFIEMMINDCYYAPEHRSFMAGVKELEGLKFLQMSATQKVETLKLVEQKAKEEMKAYNAQTIKFGDNQDLEAMNAVKMGLPFWRLMKELTLLGYYTSEGGTKASFEYAPNPGKFELTKLKPGQKTIVY